MHPLKKIISILLIVVFVLQSFTQLWILGLFYVNRDYIAQEVCINRFDLIPLCKGSCFLEEQLNQNDAQQETLPDLKGNPVQLWVATSVNNIPPPVEFAQPQAFFNSYHHQLLPQGFSTGLIKPPSHFA